MIIFKAMKPDGWLTLFPRFQSDTGHLVARAFFSISLPDAKKRAPPLLVAVRAKHDSPFSLPRAFAHICKAVSHLLNTFVLCQESVVDHLLSFLVLSILYREQHFLRDDELKFR